MNAYAEQLIPVLARSTAALAVSAVVVWGLLGLVRPASPRVRRLACFCVLLQGVVWFHVPIRLAWYEAPQPAATAVAPPSVPPSVAREPVPRAAAELPAVRHGEPPAPVTRVDHPATPSAEPIAAMEPAEEPSGFDWRGWIVPLWLGGIVGLVGLSIVLYGRVLWRLAGSRPAEGVWLAEWEGLWAEAGVRRSIPLRTTEQIGPMLCWTPRGYRVFVPRRLWRTLGASQRLAILRHELAHFQRRDPLKGLVARVLALLHWFNPLAWWAVHEFVECAEWACDRAAAGTERQRRLQYAQALLHLGTQRGALASCQTALRGGPLFRRIRRLITGHGGRESTVKKIVLLATALGLLLVSLVRVELVAQDVPREELASSEEESVAKDAAAPQPAGNDFYGDPLPPAALARIGTIRLRHGDRVSRVAFSADGKVIATLADYGTLSLWHADTGKPLDGFGLPRRLLYPAGWLFLIPNSAATRWLVLSDNEGRWHLWEFSEGALPHPILQAIENSQPQSRILRAGPWWVGPTYTITGRSQYGSRGLMADSLAGQGPSYRNFALSAHGKLLAAAWSDDTRMHAEPPPGTPSVAESDDAANGRPEGIQLWEFASGKKREELKGLWRTEKTLDDVRWIGFVPDGRRVVALSRDRKQEPPGNKPDPQADGGTTEGSGPNEAVVGDVATGKELRRFPAAPLVSQGANRSVTISPDGRLLAIGTPQGTVSLLELSSGKELRRLAGHRGAVHAVAFSPDSRLLASGGSDNVVRLWDVDSGKPVRQLAGHCSWVESVAFSPDGQTLASAGQDDTVRLWDVATGKERLPSTWHNDRALAMAFAADAKTAVTGSWDGTIRVWDAADGRPRQVVKLPRGSVVNTIALSPDGQKLAVGGVGPVQAVHLVDLPGGKITALSPPHAQPLEFNCLAFSADGKRLLSGGGGDKAARLWDVATGKELRQFVHQDVGQPRLRDGENPDRPEICAVAISRDGRTAAVATRSRMAASSFVHLWNVDTGEETRQIELLRGDADALAFSPDGKTLATGGYATRQGWTSDNRNLASLDLADGLQLWDVARGTLIRQFPGAPITHWRDMRKVNAVAFSPDGNLLASAEYSGVVLLYDPGTGELKSVLSGHRGEVRAVAFSGDGKKLASLGADQTVLVWVVQEALRLPAPKVE